MQKITCPIPLPYSYDPDHKGAPYTLDGSHWMNGGQLKQILRVASALGRVDRPDHIRYDVDSDIPEFHESVKSSKATLVNMVLGDDLQSSLTFYLAHTVSTTHSWVMIQGDDLVTYLMDLDEFKEFTEKFAGYDQSRKVVRYKADSTIMVRWFEGRL